MSITTVTTSARFSLNLNDWWKGLIVAVFTPIVTIILTSIQAGNLVFDWKAIGFTAIAALLAYVMKNFLDPAKIVINGATDKVVEAVKEGETDVKVGSTIAEIKPAP